MFSKKINNQKNDKLLLFCQTDSPGEYKLDINEIQLKDIHILYSFKIPETHINEKIIVTHNEGTKIVSVNSISLDFTSKDKLIIKYQTDNPKKLKYITLNSTSTSVLECENKNGFKECIVP